VCHPEREPKQCHPERREGSLRPVNEILRFAQDDSTVAQDDSTARRDSPQLHTMGMSISLMILG
jgi:hypothetical protein